MQSHQKHFNTTMESLSQQETGDVSMESVAAILGGGLLLTSIGFAIWEKYEEWSKERLKRKRSETPDGREKEYAFNPRKLAQVTQDQMKKTYANSKWVADQKLVQGQINAGRISHFLGDHKSLSFAQVERDFRASLVTAVRWMDQSASVVAAHEQYMKTKVMPLVRKVNESNGEEIAEQVKRLAATYKFPEDTIKTLPSLIGHGKSQDNGGMLYFRHAFNGAGSTLPALTQDQLTTVGTLLIEASGVVEKLFDKIVTPEHYWDELDVSDDFTDSIIDDEKALNFWFEPEASVDPLRFHALEEVVMAVIDSSLALERWAHASIKR